jgi:hypothetical protein
MQFRNAALGALPSGKADAAIKKAGLALGVSCGYHFTASAVSFGKGQSAVHKAAYNARGLLSDERNGRQTRDYSYLGETLFTGIFAPKNAPEWVKDREQLWNRAEAAERQKLNGQPARNVEFAFPHQLDEQQREWLLKDFVREQFVRRGMVADASIHSPHPDGDQRNFHAHVLLTMRELDGDQFAKTKNRDWNTKEQLVQWRERWAEMGARALERAGHSLDAERWRHGHQTLEEQRAAALERGDKEFAEHLDRQATTHRGPFVDAMERKGQATERAADYKATVRDNAKVAALKKELVEIQTRIEAERQLFIQLNEMQMRGPAEVVSQAVKDRVSQAADVMGEMAAKVKSTLFGQPPPEKLVPRAQPPPTPQSPLPPEVQGEPPKPPEKLDWRRYLADPDYRRAVDMLEMLPAPAHDMSAQEKSAPPEKLDWRRYRDDAAYRQRMDLQQKQQRERSRSPELER